MDAKQLIEVEVDFTKQVLVLLALADFFDPHELIHAKRCQLRKALFNKYPLELPLKELLEVLQSGKYLSPDNTVLLVKQLLQDFIETHYPPSL